MSGPGPLVLVAEDEESDALILRHAFQKAGLANPLVVVQDGQEAIDYLSGSSPYQDRAKHPLPALLLLDLKMPRMSGFDVLGWIATRPDLKHLPVVVLSSSSADADIQKAHQMGARDFLVKPHDFTHYIGIIHRLREQWLNGSH